MDANIVDEYIPGNPCQTKGGILYETHTRFGRACDIANIFVNNHEKYNYDSAITSLVFMENHIKSSGGFTPAMFLGSASHAGWCANYVSYGRHDEDAHLLDVGFIDLPIKDKLERLKYLCVVPENIYLWDICKIILESIKDLNGRYYHLLSGYPEEYKDKIINYVTRCLIKN